MNNNQIKDKEPTLLTIYQLLTLLNLNRISTELKCINNLNNYGPKQNKRIGYLIQTNQNQTIQIRQLYIQIHNMHWFLLYY